MWLQSQKRNPDALRSDRPTSTHFGLQRGIVSFTKEIYFDLPFQALRGSVKNSTQKNTFYRYDALMDHEEVNDSLAKLLESEGLDA
ncbi:hypothetical protein JHK87_048053 [Glycine soja]|nr:hypothetical protein JHK87_048053 [Glycine soja]